MQIQITQDIYRAMCGSMYYVIHSVKLAEQVWSNQFMGQHPQLSLKSVKVIECTRNEASLEELWRLFCRLSHNVMNWWIEKNQLWNLDKTEFSHKRIIARQLYQKAQVICGKSPSRRISIWPLLFVLPLWKLWHRHDWLSLKDIEHICDGWMWHLGWFSYHSTKFFN